MKLQRSAKNQNCEFMPYFAFTVATLLQWTIWFKVCVNFERNYETVMSVIIVTVYKRS